MSSDCGSLCTSLLRDYFGEGTSEIAKPLQWGPKSLTTLSDSLDGKYRQRLIQRCLIVLLEFGFVSATYNVYTSEIEYKLNMDNILTILRYPKYLLIIKKKLGNRYVELVETLICLGRASLSKVVSECIAQLRYQPDDIYDDYWDKAVELIRYEYFKRTPSYVVCTKVKPNKLFVPPTKNHKHEKKILFALNYNKFHQDMRNEIIKDAVVRTFDDATIGEVMSTILNQCADSDAPVSKPILLQLIRNNLTVGHDYLLEYITMMEEDPTQFLSTSYDTVINVTVNFKRIINCLNDSIIDQIVSYKFGESSARLFRATRSNKLLEPECLQQIALLPDDETKSLTSELFMNNYLQIQELRKPGTNFVQNNEKKFYLYHLNERQIHQELTAEIFKMIENCMTWKYTTCMENKRLLKNKARFDNMVESLENNREVDENFFENALDNLFSKDQQILLDSINKLMRKCQLSMMRLDTCLFLFHSYKRYDKTTQ